MLLTERCWTSAYVAPEILLKRPYDTQVDMWGVGIIAYMSLRLPLPPAPSIIELVDTSVLNDATSPTKKDTAKKRRAIWSKFLGSKNDENGVDKISDDGSTSTRRTSVTSVAV